MIHFPRRRKKPLSLNMAPLLDVVFLLLLFFMLTSSFTQPAIEIELPEGETGTLPEDQEVVVTAAASGALYLNTRPVSLDQLEPALRQAMARAGKRQVHFRGDERIPYRLFIGVMDRARKAGAKAIHVTHRVADAAAPSSVPETRNPKGK